MEYTPTPEEYSYRKPQVDHTPTPWIAGNSRIYGKFPVIARVGGVVPIFTAYDTNPGPINDLANARFIVQACNSHDELVVALSEFYDAVTLGPLHAAAMYGPDFDVEANLQAKGEQACAALQRQR